MPGSDRLSVVFSPQTTCVTVPVFLNRIALISAYFDGDIQRVASYNYTIANLVRLTSIRFNSHLKVTVFQFTAMIFG